MAKANRIYNDFSGMLLLDKPVGITSFKAAHTVKKVLNVKKTGHCGTLDPLATGLLLIMVGSATKLQDKFMKQDKVYRSSFLLGTETDSGDLAGTVIQKKDFLHINIDMVKNAVKNFEGEILQIPPMFSAIKHKGMKLYELARKGIEVERKPRSVTIKSIEVLSYENGVIDLRTACSSGTYIRTLAKDIGDFLGCGAVVSLLRREKIGNFDVNDALKFDELENIEIVKSKLISLEKLAEAI
ncbi:MAG: tRNA pseudouridine(55) synthase TruB [Endomicrobia bacterium]|nr:tRNA pseudouridine(55) synthase TruB [Endomicrobiia bacterium]MCL2506698.1 tRNA pseudouridine(55) synthase TruB [Endomicrobiia bacterium]